MGWLKTQSKWEKEVHIGIVIEDYNWSFIYCIPFSVTKDTKLQDFQYKLIHRILTKNSFLYKCGLKETEPFSVYQQCHFQLSLIFLSLLSEVSIYVEWHLEY
jgi:hypothetical protein